MLVERLPRVVHNGARVISAGAGNIEVVPAGPFPGNSIVTEWRAYFSANIVVAGVYTVVIAPVEIVDLAGVAAATCLIDNSDVRFENICSGLHFRFHQYDRHQNLVVPVRMGLGSGPWWAGLAVQDNLAEVVSVFFIMTVEERRPQDVRIVGPGKGESDGTA